MSYQVLLAGELVVTQSGEGVFSLTTSNNQGTGEVAINSDGTASGSRHSLPFGNLRKEVGEWPSERGFLNGTKSLDLGLTHLGAREYAAELGIFISPDPIMDLSDPQQWNAYAYANNNPTTMADPTGLLSGPACGPDLIWCQDKAKQAGLDLPNAEEIGEKLKESIAQGKPTTETADTVEPDTAANEALGAINLVVNDIGTAVNAGSMSLLDSVKRGEISLSALHSMKQKLGLALVKVSLYAGAFAVGDQNLIRLGKAAYAALMSTISLASKAKDIAPKALRLLDWAAGSGAAEWLLSRESLSAVAGSKAGKVLKRIPLVGSGLIVANDILNEGQDWKYAVLHATLSGVGSFVGAVAGGFAGTFVGGPFGTAVGAAGGAYGGDKLGEFGAQAIGRRLGWYDEH